MTTQFLIHLDAADETGVVWWAETPAVPGLSVAADTLQDVFSLALEAVEQHFGPDARLDVRFDLVSTPARTGGLVVVPTVGGPLQAAEASPDFETRRAVLAAS